MFNLDNTDWLMVSATVLGPILAVQAQKWLERWRDRERRRSWIFETLMATRGARTSADHVRALNSIDLNFYRHPGTAWFRRKDSAVLTRWREYYNRLSTPPIISAPGAFPSNEAWATWNGEANVLFLNLMEALAKATGFSLNRTQLAAGHYFPEATGQLEAEEADVRRSALQVLKGTRAIAIDIKRMSATESQPPRQVAEAHSNPP